MNPRHEAATDRDGGDAADGTTASVNAGGDNSSEPLHMRLLDAGIPVIVCRPHEHHAGCTDDCKQELTPQSGWQTITVEKARALIGTYRPGIDTLAMVGGHGIDVLDVDHKAGAKVEWVPRELQQWGCTITPSVGWHFPVPSTGYGKGDLILGDHGYAGDYVGGTREGGSRLLCFLPGSNRPKYPGKGYLEAVRWDIDRLLDSEPPDILMDICERSKLSREGTVGKPAAPRAEVAEFLQAHSEVVECEWGAERLRQIIAKTDHVVPGDQNRGRHNWAAAAAPEAVELVRGGCLDASALGELRDALARIKPGADGEWWQLVAWALTNADGVPDCPEHGWYTTGPPRPPDTVTALLAIANTPAITRRAVHDTFAHWFGDHFDHQYLDIVLAVAVTGSHLDGDPCWLQIIGGAGVGKTEATVSLAAAGCHVVSTISGEAAMLSGTTAKSRAKNATGGLLRQIGHRGTLVIKDFTTILSLHREKRAEILAALREMYDGQWTRTLGVDGGQTLKWSGRLTVISCVTGVYDDHHAVIAAMGDRFLLLRLHSDDKQMRHHATRQAIANVGGEDTMRRELSEAVAEFLKHLQVPDELAPDKDTIDELITLSDLVARARSQVARDFKGDPEFAHASEMPTRISKQLAQLWRGAKACALTDAEALAAVRRVAADSIPPDRRAVLEAVSNLDGPTGRDIEDATGMSRRKADRVLQELALLKMIRRQREGEGHPWTWHPAEAHAADMAAGWLQVLAHGYGKAGTCGLCAEMSDGPREDPCAEMSDGAPKREAPPIPSRDAPLSTLLPVRDDFSAHGSEDLDEGTF